MDKNNIFRKLIVVFLVAFALNLAWENFHSFLYVHYQDGPITEWILLRAAFVDAVIISGLICFFAFAVKSSKYSWFLMVCGVIIAIILEWWALSTGRWAYREIMPIIPFLKTGLTPTIQLGLLAYLTEKISNFLKQ